MKFVTFLSVFFAFSVAADVPDEKFFKALHLQESSGQAAPAPGDNGQSHGPLMIKQCVLDDVNETFHTSYTLTDVEANLEVSKDVARKYLARYATAKRLGHEPTYQDMARIWNRGPCGCFDNGAINRFGTKTKKDWQKLAQRQREAVRYWEQLKTKL